MPTPVKLELAVLLSAVFIDRSFAYVPSTFTAAPPIAFADRTKTNPLHADDLDIEMPNFDDLFGQIQQVSPLAQSVIEGDNARGGFASIDDEDDGLGWKRIERNKRGVIHQVDRLDGFQDRSTPVFRFRSSMTGPCVGELFGKLIINLEERKKWDAQVDDVNEIHQFNNIDAVNIATGLGKYGDCSRMGIGYTLTKASMGVSPREQLFWYGLQHFADGSSLIWGQELDRNYDHLLPSDRPRQTRAKSHLFSATLTPTTSNTFDVEYVLQLDIGGNIPQFLTSPVLVDTVKTLFDVAQDEYDAQEDEPHIVLQDRASQDVLLDDHALLMPL